MPDSKTFLITGASSGIGAQFARAYAARGHNLVLAARRINRLEDLANELMDRHAVKISCLAADLSKRHDTEHLLAQMHGLGIRPDGLINNAGYSLAHTFSATTAHAQLDFVEVCVTAPTLLSHALLPHMIRQGFGRIINVSSMVAFSPGASGHTLYPAAKAYMLKFSRSLNAEVAEKGVHVTALCPGATESEFMTANGMAQALPSSDTGHGPGRFSMPADKVVEQAIRGNEAGREVVITGFVNQAAVAAMTLLPDFIVTPLIRWGAKKYQLKD